MIYIASPYSSPLPEVIRGRVQRVTAFVDHLIKRGEYPFSPILYLHPAALRMDMPTRAEDWLGFNMNMLRRADAAYFLRLYGWEQSKGMQVERNVCKMLGIWTEDYDEDFERCV